MRKKIAVIGAGPGGLASAMLLARRGFEVQVYEKADRIGGRTGEIVLDGQYRFDIGPTFLMMNYVLEELFEDAGRRIEDYLDIRMLDPMYRLSFEHASMLVHSDPVAMKREIERCFPGEGAGLDRFLRDEEIRFRKLYPCLQRDYGSLSRFLSPTLLTALPHIALGRSLYDVLSGYFRSEELRLSFTFQSKYLGMSPWDCPGLFAMIPYTEHAHGVFHVMGGLTQIPQAFAKIAREEGAKIHTSCGVKEVLRNGRTVTGLLLENGEHVDCDEVVMNADFGHAMATLFPGQDLGKYAAPSLEKRPFSCSTLMIYLGIDRTFPDIEHHTIFFAEDYRRCLEDITKHKTVSEELSVYVRNSAPLDPSCAPEGHSALYILLPVPNNTSGIDWSVQAPIYREQVLDLIAKRSGYGDLRPHITAERMITPADWERSGVFLGATFNMGHSWDQMLYFRPHNRFELFDNLYLVGGGTHPGSGLPTIFESARISSNLICDRYKVPHPEPRPFHAELAY
ncbi:phytoene desaturase [Bryocella elongata]|uniref:Phytoene desaturase n=1 Tax=Bryocella elongata TaxID=863522 RepID=A0A1H5VYY8_9BACT|nr:phytoene desaturase family protein [Bryocella elongata]SEF92343.1 phytoene desaturase [Bryocella elongata]